MLVAIGNMPKAEVVEKAFNEAKTKNTARAFRVFRQQHKSVKRYCNEARLHMHELMNDVVKKYRSSITTHDTILTRAILAMFEYVKETDNFQVGICYKNQNLTQEQSVLINSKPVKVIPAGTAFASEKNKKREDVITDLIRKAFRMITPEDILSFTIVQTKMTKGITFLSII